MNAWASPRMPEPDNEGVGSASGPGQLVNRALRRLLIITLIVASLPGLIACESLEEACRKAHPGDPTASNVCFRAVLQQQNAQLNREAGQESRLGTNMR